MATPVQTKMTVAEFDAWVSDAEQRYEYIAGEVCEVVTNSLAARIAFKMAGLLFKYLETNDIGIGTGPDGGYQVGAERYIPDVAFLSHEHDTTTEPVAYYPVAPDWAVEVISDPSNEKEQRDLRLKIGNYVAAGTLVWIVDPAAQQIEVYEAGKSPRSYGIEDTLDGGEVLPGFTLAVNDIFSK